MEDRSQIEQALRSAHAAGDTVAAQRLAQHLATMKQPASDDGPLMQTLKEMPERLGSGISAGARTVGSLAGLATQLPYALGGVIASPFTGQNFDQIMKDSEQANPMTHINEMVKPNEFTQQSMETMGEGLDKLQTAGGRLARMPLNALGLAGVSEEDAKKLGIANSNAQAAETSITEYAGGFIPLGTKVNGKSFFKKKDTQTKSDLRSKLDAVDGEMNKQPVDDHIELYKAHAAKLQEEARNRIGGLIEDKVTPQKDAALIAEIQAKLSEEGQLPTERTGMERNTPLPEIFDPAGSADGLKPGRLGEPLRDPTMEMDPRQDFQTRGALPGQELPGPARSTPFGPEITSPGATPFEPKRPAPTNFAGQVDAARAAREERAGTIDFPGRVEHLTSDPMAQQLLREAHQRTQEMLAGVKGASARLRVLEDKLRDHGFTSSDISKLDLEGNTSMYTHGKGTLAPIEKTQGFFPSREKLKQQFPTYDGTGVVKLGNGGFIDLKGLGINPEMFKAGVKKVMDIVKSGANKGYRLISEGHGNFIAVTVYDREGNHAGGTVMHVRDLGVKPEMNVLSAAMTSTDINHRGQHLMADVYQRLADEGNHIVPAKAQTPDGQGMWRSFEKNGVSQNKLISPKNQPIMGPRSQRGMVEGMGNSPITKALEKFLKKNEDAPESKHEQATSLEQATKAIPGVGKAYDGVSRVGTDPAKVLAEHADHNKDLTTAESITGSTTSSGANLKAASSKNPFVRSTFENFDEANKAAHRNVDQYQHPLMDIDKRMSEPHLQEVAALLQKYEGKQYVPDDVLARAGYTPDQIAYYRGLQDAYKKVLEGTNEVRALRGEKPIEARAGYAANTFRGQYKTIIRDKDDSPLYVVAENTQRAHDAIVAQIKKVHKDAFNYETIDPATFNAFRGKTAMVDFFFNQFMKEIAAGDPRATSLSSLVQDWKATHAEGILGHNQHSKHKSAEAVGGAEGFRAERTAAENARDYMDAQLNYIEQGFIWNELQKAYTNTGKLADGVREKLPNTAKYIKQYRENAIGRGKNWLGRVSKALLSANPWYADKLANFGKASLNSVLLGGPLNIGFLAIQYLQVLNAIPQMISAKGRLGQSQIKAMVHDAPKAFAMAGKNVITDKAAIQWAKDNHVIRSARWDDIKQLTQHPAANALDTLWNGPIRGVDATSRAMVYTAFVNLFEGHFKGVEKYKMAADATERAMVDYRGFESPIGLESGGTLGRTAQFLHKYPANWYNQMFGFLRQKEFLPAAALVGILIAQGGLLATPFVGGYEALVAGWNAVVGSKWPQAQLPSLMSWMLKKGVDKSLMYGPISAATGIDFHSKVNMSDLTPNSAFDVALPGASFGTNVISNALDPEKSFAATAHSALPASLKGVSENMFFTDKDGVFHNPGSGDYQYKRTPGEKILRTLSMRSLDEKAASDLKYTNNQRIQKEHALEKVAITKYKNVIADSEATPFKIRKATDDLVQFYRDAGLDQEKIAAKLATAHNEVNLSYDTRQKLKADSNPKGYLKYKELRDGN